MNKTALPLQKKDVFFNLRIKIEGENFNKSLPCTPENSEMRK